MDIFAKISGIKYTPFLCRKLNNFCFDDLDIALSKYGTFILDINEKNKAAVSWWVSAKRTRSYPYARVYDSLGFAGKKITIIPFLKDEGSDGDRDFLQWDTVSLMSLLGVYVIVGYYIEAERSNRYINKITKQKFDTAYIRSEIRKLLSYQSDALHWNIGQIEKIGELGERALEACRNISCKLGIKMHSYERAKERVERLIGDKEAFLTSSRYLAERAQQRERLITQPKERVLGTKAIITIQNYLGGYYYFTSDEVEKKERNLYLFECKHSHNSLPSEADIKDGLVKMILFTNLEEVKVGGENYNPLPVLKLTIENGYNENSISTIQRELLITLNKEASTNGFQVIIE